MSEWPDGMKLGAIREWPGVLKTTAQRRTSAFKTTEKDSYRRKSTPLAATLELLDRELSAINAKDRELLVAIAPQDFRQDGKPRAQAKSVHPGVILSFSTRLGQLSYPCDTFTTWQDNLRAIALALEALRKVDRYGVTTNGEQYRGFLAIEGARAMPAGFASADEARTYLKSIAGFERVAVWDVTMIRAAKRISHPDTGGDAETFQRVIDAEKYLAEHAQ